MWSLFSDKLSEALNLIQVRIVNRFVIRVGEPVRDARTILAVLIRLIALISRYQGVSYQELLLIALQHVFVMNVLFATECSQLERLRLDTMLAKVVMICSVGCLLLLAAVIIGVFGRQAFSVVLGLALIQVVFDIDWIIWLLFVGPDDGSGFSELLKPLLTFLNYWVVWIKPHRLSNSNYLTLV